MPPQLLREICVRTSLLQKAHPKYFQGILTGKNTKNLNFWLVYLIKLWDRLEGTSLLKEWKYYIKLSPQKLEEYNSTLKKQMITLLAFFSSWYNKVDQISEDVEWRYLKIMEADIYVTKKKRYI